MAAKHLLANAPTARRDPAYNRTIDIKQSAHYAFCHRGCPSRGFRPYLPHAIVSLCS